MRMASAPKRLIAKPRTVLLPAGKRSPAALLPAAAPFDSITGRLVKPGWVVPSITTGSVMAGKAEAGEMVNGPEPGIWKTMVSRPLVALASRMAWRKEPLPLSLVVVTESVAGVTLSRG